MVATPRLFAGQLSPGDWRARVSKPGFDASDPSLTRDRLDFDTAWPFAGNIHAVASRRIIGINASQSPGPDNSSPLQIFFPALPYVPCVKVFLSSPDGSTIWWREDIGPLAPGAGSLTYEAYNDRVVIYSQSGQFRFNHYLCAIVFKIPARDLDIVGDDPHPLARMMMGKRGNEYGLYVSRPGFDVETCSKAQMVFSSDDDFSVINKTYAPASSRKGAADSPTDNVYTDIDFTYEWKGYYPIIFFFGTFNGAQNDQIYTLPSDKEVNTYGSAYPMSGYVITNSPGVAQAKIRRWGNGVWGNVSIIVIDKPVPTD
ncbi:hypothetical protein [Kaistia nematophila]|uniref:Uncharacterized protein n=2 Tax=Kaistia TaxID=166953 RepID=A0A9X3ECV1_9HYPH|nr:hypothetical protein [Kaistia nematophila]MCX5570625.1 hypothetical protein [Kaistia nematophila]